ncbi:MAG: Uma2 family endonuclease [Agriterribacter sp.]
MENEVKEPAPKYNYVLPEDYLVSERASENKHEYYDGHVIAMSGASLRHNYILVNLIGSLSPHLALKGCQMLASKMRIGTPSYDYYMYPDAVIVCGGPELQDNQFDALLNPTVIFEILSPSTASVDKGRKFFFYRAIPSFKEYIMIDTMRQLVIVSRKQPDNSWVFENIHEDMALSIQTIDFTLTLQEIYNGTGL